MARELAKDIGGGTPKLYMYLSETFLPKLAAGGVDPAMIDTPIRDNPFRALTQWSAAAPLPYPPGCGATVFR